MIGSNRQTFSLRRRFKIQYTKCTFIKASLTLTLTETDMDWGVHEIGIAEYSSDKNAAVCIFRVFKTRKLKSKSIKMSRECSLLSRIHREKCHYL